MVFRLAHEGGAGVGFLAVALDEVAEYHERIDGADKRIACHECADELTQMNSQHQGSIEPVVYDMTGLSFSASWQGGYGERSDAHRHALRAQ